MYILIDNKKEYILSDDCLDNLDGFLFGVKNKGYKIKGHEVQNLLICNDILAYPIVKKQIDKKFKKLMIILPDLIVSDEGDGESLREALNQIEKFRQIIKNKYRQYLTHKELDAMSKKLSMIKKETNNKIIEVQLSLSESKNRSSCK